MKLLSIPTQKFTKVFSVLIKKFETTKNSTRNKWKISDIPIQRSYMAHIEVRGKGHFEFRGKLPPCAIHGMVDQRWKTVRDQRRVQRRMLHNIIQAHGYDDLRYA